MSKSRVLGRVEMAVLLEVDTRTPHAWFSRGLLPPPDHDEVNGGPAWDRDTIITWAYQTGRLPEALHAEVPTSVFGPQPGKRGGRSAKKSYGTSASREGEVHAEVNP